MHLPTVSMPAHFFTLFHGIKFLHVQCGREDLVALYTMSVIGCTRSSTCSIFARACDSMQVSNSMKTGTL